MSYLLDTNAVVALLRGNAAVARQARLVGNEHLLLSTIVRHELYYGAYGGDRTNETLGELTGWGSGSCRSTMSTLAWPRKFAPF